MVGLRHGRYSITLVNQRYNANVERKSQVLYGEIEITVTLQREFKFPVNAATGD